VRLAPVALAGRYITLEPLTLGHLDGLCVVGLEESLWQWVPTAVRDREEMRLYIETALAEQKRGVSLPFATTLRKTKQLIGSTRFANIEMGNRRVEIGWTWIGVAWQRSVINTEAKYLMLRHAFEEWHCLRVELKTDALNERSRKAILRLGAKEEGILRKHIVTSSGRVRDTVYYSILDNEWPSVKAGLQAKLTALNAARERT